MRNWSAILIDAGLRGLSAREIAQEQNCGVDYVARLAKAYGMRLSNARTKWRDVFAATESGLSVNDFCRRHGCAHGTAIKWAARCGYEFNPTRWAAIRRTAAESTSA